MTLGFSIEKLGNIQAFVKSYVDDGKLPGYLCLVSRYGEEAHFVSYGKRDVERGTPISRDTVFRIYSMTKPITSVALMMLYEKGAFQLDDPVAKYIPQWRDLKVFAGGDEKSYQVSAPARPMNVKDLLTHCSGLTYGFLGTHPVDAMYRTAKIGGGAPGATLAGMIDDLARIPLQFSPGTQWNYSVSTDVLGYLVQVLADQDFDQFVAEKITRPLGMDDTGFFVAPKNHDRFAACYDRVVATNSLKLQDDPKKSPYLTRPTFLSGGGGMVSTIDDYHTFTRMLLGKGAANDVRILGRKTVEYMTLNHLPGQQGPRRDGSTDLQRNAVRRHRLRARLLGDTRSGDRERARFARRVRVGRRGKHVFLDRSGRRTDRHLHDAAVAVVVVSDPAAVEGAGVSGADRLIRRR